jgi:hypothetical protein
MNNSNEAVKLQRKLLLMSIGASIVLIVSMLVAYLLTNGLRELGTGYNILFGLVFWLTSGAVAGLVLGKMDSVVGIGNREGRCTFKSEVDNFIVSMSCSRFGDQLVQNNIANLWSGVIGVAIVYAICQLLCAITGITMLGTFPSGLPAVMPFVIAWKLFEGRSRDIIMRRHFNAASLEAAAD